MFIISEGVILNIAPLFEIGKLFIYIEKRNLTTVKIDYTIYKNKNE
jgi:hypothetical protein